MDHTETAQCSSSAQLHLKPKHGADKLDVEEQEYSQKTSLWKVNHKLLLEHYPSLHEAASRSLFQQNLP